MWKSKRKSGNQRGNGSLSGDFCSSHFPVKIQLCTHWDGIPVDAMTSETPSPPKSPLKNPYLYSSVLIIGVILYVSYVIYSRYESSKDYERQTRQRQAEQRREEDRLAVEQLGGSELAIRGLYISPRAIHPGETAQLCYDVANAKTVTLDPPAGDVWPSHSRCLIISPRKSTTYTLTITDAAGKTVSQAVELPVR
jgi:hypothetical protein